LSTTPTTTPDADGLLSSSSAEPEASISTEAASATTPPGNGMDQFHSLQRRLFLFTGLAAALAVPAAALLFGTGAAASLLIGALAGLLYLRLLARSVSRLGGQSRSIGKAQLLVPLVLLLAAARLPQLEILPALVGFLLYKPAVLAQAIGET
jgi:ATP synthase protein I